MQPDPSVSVETNGEASFVCSTDDVELLVAVRHGDRAALAALYDRYADSLFHLALRVLRDRRDAEDLLHDVFLEVWKKARDYDPERGSARSWLRVRVRSRAIDRLRRIERAKQYAIAAPLVGSPLEENRDRAGRAPDRRAAAAALERLSSPLRLVATLVYIEGWTCQEVAARHDLPLGTVKSRLAAAKARLRRLCRDDDEKCT